MTGFQAALSVVGARVRQLKGAPAQRLDVSQIEVGAALIGPLLLDCSLNGAVLNAAEPGDRMFPPGNRAHWPRSSVNGYRYEGGAPYNVYPTSDAGHNGFCAVSVLNEPEWDALRTAMGDPEWAADEKYATEADRIRNQNELDMHVSEWTRQHGKYELMALLRAAGVRAGALQTGMDRLENDESLRARGVFQPLTHDVVGEHRYQSFPMLVDGEPLAIRPLWPILGRDTESVLSNELGLSDGQVDELRAQNAIWPAHVARPGYAEPQPAGLPPAPAAAHDATDVRPTDAAPLAGITVVALDAGFARYTGKILTDFGARVILVEPPGGTEQRRATPTHHARDGRDYSIPFAYYHAGQESVTVDLSAPGAAARLEPLIRQADVLLDGLGAGVAGSSASPRSGWPPYARDSSTPPSAPLGRTARGASSGPPTQSRSPWAAWPGRPATSRPTAAPASRSARRAVSRGTSPAWWPASPWSPPWPTGRPTGCCPSTSPCTTRSPCPPRAACPSGSSTAW